MTNHLLIYRCLGRKWQKKSTPVFFLRELHGQRNLVGYSTWDRKESDMTEWLTHTDINIYLTRCLFKWDSFWRGRILWWEYKSFIYESYRTHWNPTSNMMTRQSILFQYSQCKVFIESLKIQILNGSQKMQR